MWTRRRSETAKVLAERYRLERELARGGMGTIWLAVDTKLDREVAIKLMAHELAQQSEAKQRFEREALAVAKLDSNHVVQVFDYGLIDNLPYIVMERLTGESVSQRLRRIKRFSLPETLEIVSQACKGLKAAHQASLVHRDLKPSNVFIARRDDAEIIKLLDFGVVKAVSPPGGDITQAGALMGTPQYMSPEQARAMKDIDHRSDLWSVSVITFRMLTGQSPFKSESVVDVILKICSGMRQKITDVQQDLPAALDGFFHKAFAPEPDDRFQSAQELADALEQAMAADASDAAIEAPAAQAAVAAATTPAVEAATGPEAASPAVALDPDATIPEHEGAPTEGGLADSPVTEPQPATEPIVPAQAPAEEEAPSTDPLTIPTPTTPSPTGARHFEPTPHSATVGGTAGAVGRRPMTEPFGIVVGACGALAVAGVVAAIWVGGESDEVAAPASTGLVPPVAVELPAPEPTGSPRRPASTGGGILDENDFDAPPPAGPSASTPKPRFFPPVRPQQPPASSAPTPPPEPSEPPKKQNPDW